MKRFILMFALLLILASCGQDPADITLPTDDSGAYTGFADIPFDLTSADAEKQGWYVIEDSTLIAGVDAWQKFLATSEKGRYRDPSR